MNKPETKRKKTNTDKEATRKYARQNRRRRKKTKKDRKKRKSSFRPRGQRIFCRRAGDGRRKYQKITSTMPGLFRISTAFAVRPLPIVLTLAKIFLTCFFNQKTAKKEQKQKTQIKIAFLEFFFMILNMFGYQNKTKKFKVKAGRLEHIKRPKAEVQNLGFQ